MQPKNNIREIFSEPIVLDKPIPYCPNCGWSKIQCIENYVNDYRIRVFECDYCGAMWEVKKKM